jgi:hypothetical protein
MLAASERLRFGSASGSASYCGSDDEALYQELSASTGALNFDLFKREHVKSINDAVSSAKGAKVLPTPVRFLPLTMDGKVVLVHEGGRRYRVDNSQLQSTGPGLGYRLGKNLDHRALTWRTTIDRTTIGGGAAWGTTVEGIDEGDGWLKIQVGLGVPQSDRLSVSSSCSTATPAGTTHVSFSDE